jgi:hypothetical protein
MQVGLGLGTWVVKYNYPDWLAEYTFAQSHQIVSNDFFQVQIVTAHVAVGSLILGVATFLLTRLWRAEFCLRSMMPSSRQATTTTFLVERTKAIVATGGESWKPC